MNDGNVVKLAANDPERHRVSGGNTKPSAPPNMIEKGVPTGMPFSSYTDWITGRQIAFNTSPVSIDQLVEMRQKDGTVRALLGLITLPIVQSLRESEFVEPEEGGAEKEVEFCNQMFSLPPSLGGMTVPRNKMMKQILLAISEGFSAFEEVRQVPDTGPLKGKWTLKKLAHRDSRTIQFLVDDHGGFDGLKQIATVKGERKEIIIKQPDSWYWAVNEAENAFYGVSALESAWNHWDIKRKLYYIAHIAAQMAAVPGRVGTVPAAGDPNEINAFLKMLGDFGFNTAGVKKEGYEIDWATMNSNFDFLGLINHQNAQMAKSVLAPWLEQDQRQVLIDESKDASADFFVMSIESFMNEIAENISHYLMPKYIDWNFNSGKYPEFRFGTIADSTKDVIKDLFTTIATAQATQWTPEFIRELEMKLTSRLGLDVDYDEVDKRVEEEKQEQADQLQQYYDSKGGGAQQEPGAEEQGGGQPGGAPAEQPAVVAASAGGTLGYADLADRMLKLAQRKLDADGTLDGPD